MATFNGQAMSALTDKPELVRELYSGEVYEYYPLGRYIVAARAPYGVVVSYRWKR